MKLKTLAAAAAAVVLSAPFAFAQGTYKKEIPDALAKKAKVTEEAAAKVALARVPKGQIETVELEEENGKLIYSYDIKVPGKSGIDEVAVSALTGKVIAFAHETPKDEKKEAADDAKAAKKAEAKKADAAKPKKP